MQTLPIPPSSTRLSNNINLGRFLLHSKHRKAFQKQMKTMSQTAENSQEKPLERIHYQSLSTDPSSSHLPHRKCCEGKSILPSLHTYQSMSYSICISCPSPSSNLILRLPHSTPAFSNCPEDHLCSLLLYRGTANIFVDIRGVVERSGTALDSTPS